MNLNQLFEMAAKKLCDKCGKTMAANHYWYKGGWRCKGQKGTEEPATSDAPQQPQPDQPPTQPQQQTQPQPADATAAPAQQDQQHTPDPKPSADQQTTVSTQPLSIEVTVIEEVMPYLEAEIEQVNKTAKRVGAPAVTVEVIKTEMKEVKKTIHRDEPAITFMQKMLTVRVTGTTPRITGADGSVWNFVGVITPSAQGRALLKLTPGAEDSEGVRKLYHTNPYYCDYCKKVRQRNETFIVTNNGKYMQVGRNCLKDFVGGANPQALVQFFTFFNDKMELEARLQSHGQGGDDDPGFYGGRGGRGTMYFTPNRLLELTVAAVNGGGGYVSAKAEDRLSTAAIVRTLLWGSMAHMKEPERKWYRDMADDANSEESKKKAQEIIDWFKQLPPATIESNTFFQNIKLMMDEGAVGEKQVGYLVGLYAAYDRSARDQAERTSRIPMIKEWPSEWGEGPKTVENRHAVVKYVRQIDGTYGSSQLATIQFDSGHTATWRYSGRNEIKQGQEFNVTGHLEQDDYRTPATIKFVPDRKWLRSAFKE